jgi:hypothetical protein
MGGCSLNFVDIGDVQSHDMLRGVITAIDASDDTCTVTADGRILTKVPLFFNGGLNTNPRDVPPGIWSVRGAAVDFEVGDSVLMMVGRGAFNFENFVFAPTAGKSLRYYLADFKKAYVLHPTAYVNASQVDHYAPDQVRIRPYWMNILGGRYVYPTFSIPVQSEETPKRDWFLRIPSLDPSYWPAYNILIVETAPIGYYLDPPLDGGPYRPSSMGKTYTFWTNIAIPQILLGQIPVLSVDLGYCIGSVFYSLRSIIAGQELVLGDNLATFDFVFEDLYLGPPGYTVALQVFFSNLNLQGNWDIYSILPTEVMP